MTVNTNTSTQASLLARLNDPQDHQAWQAFVSLYAPQVFRWARRHGVQHSDAADVTQAVLLKLVRAMREFHYDPQKGRFRGWLRTVTANAVRTFAAREGRSARAAGGSSVNVHLAALQDPAPMDELHELLDRQAEHELLQVAEDRVRLKVKPANWNAWRLTMKDGLTPAQAARQLQLRPSDVYVARTRITQMLQREVVALGGGSDV